MKRIFYIAVSAMTLSLGLFSFFGCTKKPQTELSGRYTLTGLVGVGERYDFDGKNFEFGRRIIYPGCEEEVRKGTYEISSNGKNITFSFDDGTEEKYDFKCGKDKDGRPEITVGRRTYAKFDK